MGFEQKVAKSAKRGVSDPLFVGREIGREKAQNAQKSQEPAGIRLA